MYLGEKKFLQQKICTQDISRKRRTKSEEFRNSENKKFSLYYVSAFRNRNTLLLNNNNNNSRYLFSGVFVCEAEHFFFSPRGRACVANDERLAAWWIYRLRRHFVRFGGGGGREAGS